MLTMSLRLISIPHLLSLSEPFIDTSFYWYGHMGTCCREIAFRMNCQSLWLDHSWVHCILCFLHSQIPLFSIPSHSLLLPQTSLLEHPGSPAILCKPSQTHSHFSCSKHSSFDSPSYICDLPSIFTFMMSGCWLFIGSWSFEAVFFLMSWTN